MLSICCPYRFTVQVGTRDSSYSDFLVDLHQKEGDSEDCRYGLYDYDYQVKESFLAPHNN